jgi:nitrite reductase/ring-hydroxylating ferredoxin subunit
MKDTTAPCSGLSRRDFLKQTIGLGGALALTGCGLLDETELHLGTTADLKSRVGKVFEWNGKDFYLGLDEKSIPYVLSLVCTHKQCTVAWKSELGKFICPCHKGEYDQTGKVLKGKPSRALDRYRLEERADGWWLLNQPLN